MMPNETWLPQGGGEMGALIRQFDWSCTPLGPFSQWPQSLRTALGIALDSGYGMYIAWGRDFIQLYNDAYRPILGATKHPAALGKSTRETFTEIWDFIGPMFLRVMDEARNTSLTNQLLPLNRFGYTEECYFTFSYSAIRDEGSGVGGVLVTVIETTQNVVGERRLLTLRELAAVSGQARNTDEAVQRIEEILCHNSFDIPLARLHLEAGPYTTGLIDVPEADQIECPAWKGERITKSIALPLATAGYLMAGISPRLPFDANYENFLHLVAAQVSTVIETARAYQAERNRAEALAELDRTRTAFFSNVSHEFRTPLTLLLGPLEKALEDGVRLPPELRESLGMAHRNSLRLLKLVNTLLEFSRIEAGRVHVRYEATDLPDFTSDVASAFRSTIGNAGLQFDVNCPPLPQAVYVDREMWEKVVLNLVSNAFKYTLQGRIAVSVRGEGDCAVLEVADTGIGIPQAETPHVLERFHRVEGARGRTFEGTGIGLALVAELVRMHGGTITVASEEGKGSVFTVRIPFGNAHLQTEQVGKVPAEARHAFVEEARRWNPKGSLTEPQATPAMGKVLFADDNADAREYVSRILSERFTVMAVANGQEALDAVEGFHPDLVLSDVMMPRLNGYELLAAIRANEKLHTIPVVLLSARAGEEARIEGLNAGADDYLVKPFSARELLARVASQITIGQLRQRTSKAERQSREAADTVLRHFRDLLMQAPAAIAVVRGPEHVFELANADYLKMLGFSNESELLGKRVVDVLPEVGEQGFIALLDGVLNKGIPFIGRELPLRLTGMIEPLYVNFVYQPIRNAGGVPEGIFVHATDVSDLAHSRRLVEDSERQLRTLAESIPQLVWTCLPDGNCDYLSTQWVTYTGIPEGEQLGLRWLDLVMHPDDRERTYQVWMGAVEDRNPYDIEYRLRRFDGAYRWFKTRGTPVRNGAGEIQKWFGTCTDIEDQKLAEQHMLQQQKLESVGLLAGGIAHDFNNLLVGVLGNASLIDDSLPEQHPLRPMVHGIVEAGERAAHLTRQMLAYAGKGRIYIERVDLNELARSTAALVEASFPKSVRTIIESHPSTPVIEADSGQIQQVIMNLAINGAEAIGSEASGSVWIRTGRAKVDEEYLSKHRFISEAPRPGIYACMEVEDTGSGIAPDAMAKIFDPFFTTKFTGRGLGLAAVLGIVRAAQGAIEVTSAVGQGTCFRVLLPLTDLPAPASEPNEPRQTESLQTGATVLVIDDEHLVRQTTRAALRRAGYTVLLAEDGLTGLETFRARAAEIALVILDMSMPGLGGKEVLERLRVMNQRVPVLIFSGFSEQQAHQHLAGMTISGFLQKPFTGHQIASAVHQMLQVSG